MQLYFLASILSHGRRYGLIAGAIDNTVSVNGYVVRITLALVNQTFFHIRGTPMQAVKTIATVAAATMIILSSGCATIINDKTQKLNISTSNGAKVSGTFNGQTFDAPGVVEVIRANKDATIIVKQDGCAEQTIANKKVDTVFFMNVLLGGGLGSTTDYATEKMWKYDDNLSISCK